MLFYFKLLIQVAIHLLICFQNSNTLLQAYLDSFVFEKALILKLLIKSLMWSNWLSVLNLVVVLVS